MSSPSLSLRELFRLAFTEPVYWLAGDENSRPHIHWVSFNLSEVQPGDLFILESGKNPALWNTIRARGVAAVLVLQDAPEVEDIPEGLTVAAVAGNSAPQAAQRSLLTILINQRAALMERGVSIHTQLSQLTAEGEGLPGLAQAIAELSGRGVIVQDKRLSILAEHSPAVSAEAWQSVLKRIINLDSLPEALRDRKQAAAVRSAPVEQELAAGMRRLVAPIIVGGMARGYLSILSQTGELDALDGLIAEQSALVCGVEMARTKAVRETEKRLKGDLLNALLQENLLPRDAELWVQGMDLDLTQSHAALRFAWAKETSPSRRRLETIINGEVARHGLRVFVSPMGNEIVCFSEMPPGSGRPEGAIRLGQAVIDQGVREYPDIPLLCGIGTPAGDLSEWRVSFRQAGQALELARRFKERKTLYFPDLSVYRLLIQIEHSPELVTFQEETLGPLLANEGGRELIRTLEAYFEHNGNLSQTAEALYIHRNTLIYRMERIANITGLDLDNPETRLAVQLALHIYRMMGKMRA